VTAFRFAPEFQEQQGAVRSWGPGLWGGPGVFSCCPFFDFIAATYKDDLIMNCKCRMFLFNDVELFHEKSAQVGLTEDDIWDLVASGMEVSHLVEYVDAMLSSRVN
jgi:hypothetical protein